MEESRYLCIDLKSFYASVECAERGLDPMEARLAVADPARGQGTVCLAVSPAMKAMGVKNRCRVYQIPKHVKYIMAPPRMKLYIQYSAAIYGIYLKYFAKEDIHMYSIDEAFMDMQPYRSLYQLTARELAAKIMADIRETTGIPAAAGTGTNLYLAKVALDITAKHVKGNIGCLDETLYRETLWGHRPLTDFWRIGEGIEKRLASVGIHTMGEVAHADEAMLYRMFGVDAELLIDHAWGRESTTLADIKAYAPKRHSLSSSQALFRDYNFEEGILLVKEMLDSLCLDMAAQGAKAQSLSLGVGYSHGTGLKPDFGSISMPEATGSYRTILPYALGLYSRIVQKGKPIRKVTASLSIAPQEGYQQYHLFEDGKAEEREQKLQQAVLGIKQKYGKNAIVRGMDLLEAATAMERNRQIGGHRSGE